MGVHTVDFIFLLLAGAQRSAFHPVPGKYLPGHDSESIPCQVVKGGLCVPKTFPPGEIGQRVKNERSVDGRGAATGVLGAAEVKRICQKGDTESDRKRAGWSQKLIVFRPRVELGRRL